MGLTPARLRIWIVAVAGLLVASIAGFAVYGRWQGRRLSRDLPRGLGSSIQQSTSGFTYSESRGGHTIYTLHASKAVQYKKGGNAELHDVSITLYSAKGTPDNRIYGSAFDWDPVHGIARAMGEVQIDLRPEPPTADPGSEPSSDDDNRNSVHVKTSGLIFNKQTGLASTSEKIEFRMAEAAGSAIGASFDSQTGVAVLTSAVAFNSSIDGNPLTVRANHAQYDRGSRQLYLLQEQTDYAETHSSSDQAIVSFRPDGSASEVRGEGNVVLTGTDGQQIKTNAARIELGPRSEPRQAHLDRGFLYVADMPARALHGSASSATLLFGPQASLRHAQLLTAVSVVDDEKLPAGGAVRGKQNSPVSATREVQASKVDIDFTPGADRVPVAKQILASGGARVNVRTLYAKTPPEETTIQGDQLLATLTGGETLSALRATGHSSLRTASANGATQSSASDNLLLTFAAPPKGSMHGAQPAAQLESAVQTGNVTLMQQGPPVPGGKAAEPVKATAQKGVYDGSTQVMDLTGNPRIEEASGELAANEIRLERATGDGEAIGSVKATYRQSGGVSFTQNGPVHVVADRASLNRAKDLTTFSGSGAQPARLWQGSDAVTAPVLELSRKQGTLFAQGDAAASGPGEVNAVFTSTQARPVPEARALTSSVVRVRSRTLLYTESEHKAVFSGAVLAQTNSGRLRASVMDVYFTSAPAGAQAKEGQRPGQSLSKIVARGAVEIEEPNRKGSGEELTYSAADGKFVLTGSRASPPRLVDEARGSITGNALIFNDRDDSVVVSGGADKVVTQTRVAK
jgi:lipopolysaccharide export system protein LptA